MEKLDWFSEVIHAFKTYQYKKSASEQLDGYKKYQGIINPANGLPMVGSCDIHGNPYGVPSPIRHQSQSETHHHYSSYDSFKPTYDYHNATGHQSYDYYNDPFRNH